MLKIDADYHANNSSQSERTINLSQNNEKKISIAHLCNKIITGICYNQGLQESQEVKLNKLSATTKKP